MNQDDPELGSEQEGFDRSDLSSEEQSELNDLGLDLISEIEVSDSARDSVLSGLAFPSVREILKTFESRGSSAPTSPVKQKRPSVTLPNRAGSWNSLFKMALSAEVLTALVPINAMMDKVFNVQDQIRKILMIMVSQRHKLNV